MEISKPILIAAQALFLCATFFLDPRRGHEIRSVGALRISPRNINDIIR
ncbi:MAG: hypothetical protein WBP83_03665 [Nitrososphaeraceae archaeon]